MDHAPLTSVLPTLPARWYQDAEHHRREMRGKDAGGRFVRTSSGYGPVPDIHRHRDIIKRLTPSAPSACQIGTYAM